MKVTATAIPGCFELEYVVADDPRGRFVKFFHEETFARHGLATHFAEEYYSTSRRNVLRGLHFQTPPHQHAKVVFCVEGTVFDAAVDLRVGSPSYGLAAATSLSAEAGNALYLPPGLAHGFQVLSETATLVYMVTSAYSPASDTGIRWDTAGIEWPHRDPVLSERDCGLMPLSEFESPFSFGG